MEEPQIKIDARVLVGQNEANVLPLGGMLRGVAEIHRRELQRRSQYNRGAGTRGEVYHRRHRQLRLRHTDKRPHQRGIRVSSSGEKTLEAELQGDPLEDAANGHAGVVQAAGCAGHRSERHHILQERRVADSRSKGENWRGKTRLHRPADRAEEQGRSGERKRRANL